MDHGFILSISRENSYKTWGSLRLTTFRQTTFKPQFDQRNQWGNLEVWNRNIRKPTTPLHGGGQHVFWVGAICPNSRFWFEVYTFEILEWNHLNQLSREGFVASPPSWFHNKTPHRKSPSFFQATPKQNTHKKTKMTIFGDHRITFLGFPCE